MRKYECFFAAMALLSTMFCGCTAASYEEARFGVTGDAFIRKVDASTDGLSQPLDCQVEGFFYESLPPEEGSSRYVPAALVNERYFPLYTVEFTCAGTKFALVMPSNGKGAVYTENSYILLFTGLSKEHKPAECLFMNKQAPDHYPWLYKQVESHLQTDANGIYVYDVLFEQEPTGSFSSDCNYLFGLHVEIDLSKLTNPMAITQKGGS